MHQRPLNVLITGVRAPASLELCRIFAGAGHRVSAADSFNQPIAKVSGAVSRFHHIPSARFAFQEFANAILSIVEKDSIDCVIPSCEEVFYLSYLATKKGIPLFAPGFEMIEQLHHKKTILTLAKNCGAEIPETISVTDSMKGKGWVFKPAYSRFASKVQIEPNFFTKPKNDQAEWLAQQRILGHEFSSYSIAKQGRLRAHVCYRSMKRNSSGPALIFEPFSAPKIESIVSKIIKKHKLPGQLGFDWIKADGTEQIFLIECNPRCTSGVHFFGPYLANCLSDEYQPLLLPETDTGPQKVALPVLLKHFLNTPKGAKDVVFDRRDWKPTVQQFASITEIIGLAIRHRCSLAEATTIDLEWNGEPICFNPG